MEEPFDVVEPNGDRSQLHELPVETSLVVEPLVPGRVIWIDDKISENQPAPDGWRYVTYRRVDTSRRTGWIRTKFIGPAHEFDVKPVDLEEFVHRCGRTEIKANSGGSSGAPAILADYLIALAWIESELTKFGNRLPDTSAIGPYQITREEWSDFLKNNPDSGYAPFQQYQALAQVVGAEFLTQCDWEALQAEAVSAGIVETGQEYIPSFLLLFQSRIIGAKAAFALNRLHVEGDPQVSVARALETQIPDADERASLINRRRRFLRQGPAGNDTTVDEFVEKTSNILGDAFRVSFRLLKEHFPEFAIPPKSVATPWLQTAIQEEAYWGQADVAEDTPLGQDRIIKEYFHSTDYHPTSVKPWCGAFVAWCMAQNNAPIVPGAATAKNWKTWGEFEIRKGGLTDPAVVPALEGAVVVLHPAAGTGTSGHVCFALNRMETSNKIKCLGGNQSDTVRRDAYDVSRIASIRALVQVEMPAGDDQLILARTLYGEAAGEKAKGKEAVAEVVVNRARSSRYPNAVADVCLQPWQFSCWNSIDPNRAKIISLSPGTGDAVFDACFEIAGRALNGQIHHLSDDVLHYHADYINSPSWVRFSPNSVLEVKIGRHLFYRGIA